MNVSVKRKVTGQKAKVINGNNHSQKELYAIVSNIPNKIFNKVPKVYEGKDKKGRFTNGHTYGRNGIGVKSGDGKKKSLKTRVLRVQRQIINSIERAGGKELWEGLWHTNQNAMIGLVGKMLPRHSEIQMTSENKAIVMICDQTIKSTIKNLPAEIDIVSNTNPQIPEEGPL